MKGLIYMLPESVMWKKVFVKIKQNSRRICVILFDKLVGLQPANPESPTPVRPGRRGGGVAGGHGYTPTHPPRWPSILFSHPWPHHFEIHFAGPEIYLKRDSGTAAFPFLRTPLL